MARLLCPPPSHPSTPSACTHRPREAEVDADGVGEGALRDGVRHLEGVEAQHRRHGAAVRARRLRGGVGLVVFEADAEKGLTLALLLVGRGQAALAAVPVALHALLVEELLQLELKDPRTEPLRRDTTLGELRARTHTHTQSRLCI